jgi:hypothetical protein
MSFPLPDALYTDQTAPVTGSPEVAPASAPVFFGPPRPPPPHFLHRPTQPRIDEHEVPDKIREHGADFRRFLNREIVPTCLQGFKLLATHEPEKPIKALGEYLLGVPIVAGDVRTPYRRGYPAAGMVLEANMLLSTMEVKPQDPRDWMGRWLLARSAEYE